MGQDPRRVSLPLSFGKARPAGGDRAAVDSSGHSYSIPSSRRASGESLCMLTGTLRTCLFADAPLFLRDHHEAVAVLEGVGNVARAHRKDALQVERCSASMQSLMRSPLSLENASSIGTSASEGCFAARFVAFVSAQIAGEDRDEIGRLVFAAAEFSALPIDARSAPSLRHRCRGHRPPCRIRSSAGNRAAARRRPFCPRR